MSKERGTAVPVARPGEGRGLEGGVGGEGVGARRRRRKERGVSEHSGFIPTWGRKRGGKEGLFRGKAMGHCLCVCGSFYKMKYAVLYSTVLQCTALYCTVLF